MATVPDPTNEGISPPPPGITPDFLNPPDHQLGVIPILVVFNTLATICLAFRLYTKAYILKFLGWEDLAIAVAWGCNIAIMVLYFVGIPLHNETHIWDLSIKNYVAYIKPAVAVDLLLSPNTGLPKIAILLFYLRINPSRNFHICVWIGIALTWGFIISTFCAILFACRPVRKLWEPSAAGSCIGALPILLAIAIISTALDIMILALPVPMLIKLRANLRTKLVVAAIFSAFSCTTIITAVRIWLLTELQGDKDITWDASLVGDLNLVESNMMVVCSSVLVLRPFCRRYFPSLLGRDSKPSIEAMGRDDRPNSDEPSKNQHHTRVRGGKAKGRGPSRNLWSISFGNTTKDDDGDLESLETELKRLPPTAADMGGGAEKHADDKQHLPTLHSRPFDGTAPAADNSMVHAI